MENRTMPVSCFALLLLQTYWHLCHFTYASVLQSQYLAFDAITVELHVYAVTLQIFCNLRHDDVIRWKHFPRYWPFVRGIHRSPVNPPHKGQWRGVVMFSLICARMNGWVNNREAGDMRGYRAHYDVTVMAAPRFRGISSVILRKLSDLYNSKRLGKNR